jgi:isoleucyl-tRNA synthetase
VAEDGDLLVALDTALDPSLEAEGLAREVAHRLQAMRREAGLEISDRVRVAIGCDDETARTLDRHREWLAGELLATEVTIGAPGALRDPLATDTLEVGGASLDLSLARA